MIVNSQVVQTKIAPVCDTSQYAAGDLIGGKLTLSNVTTYPALGGVIQNITVADRAEQKSDLVLLFFTEDPANTTFTDNAELDVADADLLNAFMIPVAASDYVSFADNALATIAPSVAFNAPNGVLYLAVVVGGSATPTFTAAGDLQITIAVV
jgi:hypothetical protein